MSRHKVLTLWNEEQLNEEETRILRTPCSETPVPFDAETTKAIRALRGAFLEREDAVGLAAPQIGIGRRIIAFRCRNFDDKDPATRKEDYEILINPRITQAAGRAGRRGGGVPLLPGDPGGDQPAPGDQGPGLRSRRGGR